MREPLILWEDNHLLIVSKPAGMLVQGDITGDRCLKDWAEEDVARRFRKPGKAFIGLPHRLDRPTSGLVVLAKTSKALARMNAVFSGRDIQKTYWAIVEGHVDPQRTLGPPSRARREDQKKFCLPAPRCSGSHPSL